MSINYAIPFYSNTPDDTHCVQASFKMIAEYFRPELVISFEEWDKISQKKEDGWTWTFAGLLWFKRNGFDVVHIDDFDYPRFIAEGKSYLSELYGEEVTTIQSERSDIEGAQKTAEAFAAEIRPQIRKPSMEEIKMYLDKGYLVAVSLNIRILNAKEGYSGHFVAVKGYDDTGLILNDPGTPAMENRHVPYELFYSAWACPNDMALNLVAIRDTK